MPFTDQEINQMTPEQREATAKQLEQYLAQQQPQVQPRRQGFNLRGAILGGLQGGARYLSGMGEGVAQPTVTPSENINQWLLKEQLKSKLKPKTIQEQAFEATQAGKTISGLTPEQTQKAAGVYMGTGGESVAEKKFKLEQKRSEELKSKQSQLVKDSAIDMLDTLKNVKSGIGYFGLLGDIPSIPGTQRATWEANVNKLLSQKVLNILNEMKTASRTGATGFGQLSNKELRVLQDASTALKRNLSPKDALSILDDIESKLNKIVGQEQPAQAGEQQQGQPQQNGMKVTQSGNRYKIIE